MYWNLFNQPPVDEHLFFFQSFAIKTNVVNEFVYPLFLHTCKYIGSISSSEIAESEKIYAFVILIDIAKVPSIREVSRDDLCQGPVKCCLLLRTFPSSFPPNET